MKNRITAFGCYLASWALIASHSAGQIPRAADAPQPLSPKESQQSFTLPAGLSIELVASEPLIADPSAILVDHRGRFFVCELHGYNLEGHLDIQQLNKSGELDREVRRVFVKGELLAEAKRQRTGAVKRLIDRDGDGRMDDVEVWADDLPPCYGMAPYHEGLIVACGPDIVYLEDRDQDGAAEIRRTLFTGFDVDVMERAINTPLWGLDHWIYFASGGTSPTVTGSGLVEPVELGRTDFRIRADGSAIEAINGTNGTFGHSLTDFGDRFLISTSTPAHVAIPLPRRYLLRNPFASSPSESIHASNYNRIYPTSQPHPWRAARGADPAWVKFYGSNEATPNGFFTSGCAPLVYRAGRLPERFAGNYFCCDPSNNLVHRALLQRDGATLRVRRSPEDEGRDFLTSTDQWFRPMNLYLGPDGAIYVVDLYREIIEDYSAIPRFLQQQYGLIEGQDRGRIWRIVSTSATESRWPSADSASNQQLVAWLADSNAWWRQTAARLLIERQADETTPLLRQLIRQSASAASRVQALYTLAELGALELDTLVVGMGDPHPQVRRHALRLAERFLADETSVLERLLAMTDDNDPLVRLQLALTLGESKDPQVVAALAELAIRHGDERWMSAAIVSSLPERASLLLEQLAKAGEPTAGCRTCLSPLAACVGARRDPADLDRVLTSAAAWTGPGADDARIAILKGLNQALHSGGAAAPQLTVGKAALESLLRSNAPAVVQLAFRIAGQLALADSPLVLGAFQQSLSIALNPQRSTDERIASIEILQSASWELRARLVDLIDARQPPGVQLTAVAAIAADDHDQVAPLLLSKWDGLSPQIQEAIMDALFARRDRLPALVDALAAERVRPNRLSSLRRAQLLEQSDAELLSRVKELLAQSATEPRTAVVQRFQAALQLTRDAERGQAVFEKQCAKCHRLQQRGYGVGPDLSGAQGRPDQSLLVDIFDPSRDIKPGYSVATVTTLDGRAFTGVLADDAATSVTLRREQGIEDTILRREIDELQLSSQSMMPEGLEQELSPQDVADLIGYLRRALGPRRSTGIVLFDEEPDFVECLTDGAGTATTWTRDSNSGNVSLRVTPPQRYAAQIKDWSFPIVEDPQPGEYRFLRLVWKAPQAQGVMLEIAADGRWPAANSPRRRFFAGHNTTNWQARQIARQTPPDWSVVTVDLFQEGGEFLLTGIAPTAMGGPVLFDRVVLLRSLDEPVATPAKPGVQPSRP